MSPANTHEAQEPTADPTPPAAGAPGWRRWALVVVTVVALGAVGFAVGRATAPDDRTTSSTTERSVGDLLAEAVALHASGMTDVAIERYDEILAVDPSNALALYNLGQITQQRGNLAGSIEYYDRALASDPSLSSAAFNRAIALRDLGRQDEAIAGFEAILADDPDSVGALFNLGNLYVSIGDAERGVPLINRAVELDPSLRGD